MQTSNYSAEFGRSAAVMNITLKSGSNALHGSAFEFLRNSALDANNFFLNFAHTPTPAYQQNNFGFSLGGPVVLPHIFHGRDKTFFFINYEGLRSRKGISQTVLVPSRAQLAGNLADDSAGTGIFPTNSTFCQANVGSKRCMDIIDPNTGLPFPGNVVPSNRLDPISQKWIPFIPVPNVAITPGQTTAAAFNTTAPPKERNDFNDANIRLDHSLTNNDRLWGSYSFDDRPHIIPDVMPMRGRAFPLTGQVLSVTENHVFSPTIVNEARFGYSRTITDEISQGANGTTNYSKDVFGFKNTSALPADWGVPIASISSYNTVGAYFANANANTDRTWQLYETVSVVRGAHNFKTGITYFHQAYDNIVTFTGTPMISFTGQYTKNSIADFILGYPYSASSGVGDPTQEQRANYWAGFIQDDWRITPTFTVNAGLRYEHQQAPYDLLAKSAWFDPAIAQVVSARTGGVRNGILDPDWNDFGPRAGFAYSPHFLKNTVVRGAFGVFFASDNWNELNFQIQSPAFFTSQTITSSPTAPTLSLSSLFPVGSLGSGTLTPFSLDKRNRTPYIQEWTFDVQHTFGKDWLLDLGYIGNVGQKLPQRRNENIASADPTGTIPIAQRVPYPNYSWILLANNSGWSSYNGMTVRLEKKMASGMYLLGSYTWSHAIDLGTTDDFSASSAYFKILDKGNGDADVRHRFVVSYLWELPFGHGRRFLNSGSALTDRLVSGWRLNGITTVMTGQYRTASLPTDWPVLGTFSSSRPNQVGNPYPAHQDRLHWLDISAFVYPGCPSYTPCSNGTHVQGNAARNSLEMPGLSNWDFALLKDTRINERATLQFRSEFFNGLNHTQFSNSRLNMNPALFGQLMGTTIDPREIQFGLKLIW